MADNIEARIFGPVGSAGFEPAVSPIFNRQKRCAAAGLAIVERVANPRYGRLQTCATGMANPLS